MKNICVTGGAGYVGSALVPHLIQCGYHVTVLDTFWYGYDVFKYLDQTKLTLIVGDIRNPDTLAKAFDNQDAVIHLACISNDPSFELNPELGKHINLHAFPGILSALKRAKVGRFIYASSSSVYGVQDLENVTETAECRPLTEYSAFKLACEKMLHKENMGDIEWSIVRPATVCGYAPRLRLDLSVNILTINALVKKKIIVHGGKQLRPNINIKDMVKVYSALLPAPRTQFHRQTFNAGFQNRSIMDIAEIVKGIIGGEVIVHSESVDQRSYHINSDKLEVEIGFKPESTIESAVRSLMIAYAGGKIINPLKNPMYHNIQRMKELEVK